MTAYRMWPNVVVVEHLHLGVVGRFDPHRHEYAIEPGRYVNVVHNTRVLRHHWQHFVDRMGGLWQADVQDLRPAYVEAG